MPFLQSWDGAALHVRLALLPRGDPLAPLAPTGQAFADADLRLAVTVTSGLSEMPPLGPSTTSVQDSPAPARARALFAALEGTFEINPSPPPAQPRLPGISIAKHLPESWREAAGRPPRTPYASTDDCYRCARDRMSPPLPRPVPDLRLPWGNVIAIALRQPLLAEALGIVRAISVAADAAALAGGGWLHITLDPAGDAGLGTVPGGAVSYAARIPALTSPRSLFTPVLFPVPPSGTGNYDEPMQESIDYTDGFALLTHAAQQSAYDPLTESDDGKRPAQETGVRLGWDDEQVLIWLNRQVDPAFADQDAPLGVRGYRIDAREEGDGTWHSLCRASSHVRVGTEDVGQWAGETMIETYPSRLAPGDSQWWLPVWFTKWLGPALGSPDTVSRQLSGADQPVDPPALEAIAPDVTLRYGRAYEFRVRLVDLTGSGPHAGDASPSGGIAPPARIEVRRWIKPRPARLAAVAPNGPFQISRPLLGWPALALAGVPDAAAQLIADLPEAKALNRQPGRPDPDTTSLAVEVQVRGPAHDPDADGGWRILYETTRSFPADPTIALTLDTDWVDTADVADIIDAGAGPLPLPTARDVRVRVTAVGREDPHLAYWGADDCRFGPPTTVTLRQDPKDEPELVRQLPDAQRVRALYLQPTPANEPALAHAATAGIGQALLPGDPVARIAAALDLIAHDLTLRASPGRRLVFACHSSLRHVLGPEAGSLTFASTSDVTHHWIVAVRLPLNRDWTWDNLAVVGLELLRDGEPILSASLPPALPDEALVEPERDHTEFLFLDVVDTRPAPGSPPRPSTHTYTWRTTLAESATEDPAPAPIEITLPVTTLPSQTPRVIAAGVATAPYVRAPDYSSTRPRRRALWLELDRPPDDPQDRYFARVLAQATDPLLEYAPEPAPPEPVDPPLALDPELIRIVVPGQSDERAGLAAMQQLVPAADGRHVLVPLPPGVAEDSPQLLDMFTYELRVGHLEQWSTAQGRFGPPLRLAGLQHPAPPLTCSVSRQTTAVLASAPYSRPAGFTGNIPPTRTRIWILLYAQVMLADGSGHQNVLLARRLAPPQRKDRIEGLLLNGRAVWSQYEIAAILAQLGLPEDAPLSCLAVEILPGGEPAVDPLGAELGAERILRTSPLVAVPNTCTC